MGVALTLRDCLLNGLVTKKHPFSILFRNQGVYHPGISVRREADRMPVGPVNLWFLTVFMIFPFGKGDNVVLTFFGSIFRFKGFKIFAVLW